MRRRLALDGQAQGATERGTRAGEIARGYVPGGVLVDLPCDAYKERVARMRQLLDEGRRAIYEGSFGSGPAVCSSRWIFRGERPTAFA